MSEVNLALEGHVSQSTTLVVNGVSYSANLAVEGPANNDWEDGCSSTFKERTAWWSLLLPKLAFITTIKIYYRSGKNKEMYRFRLYFSNLTYVGSEDDVLCYIYSDSGYPNVIQQKTCNIPTKTFFFVNRRSASTAVVELCYIEIFDNLAFNVTARHGSSEESLPASLSIDGNTTSCISSISTNYYLQIDTGFLCVINMVYIALRGCPFEKYGDNCEFLCSTNCVGHCNLVTGNCSLGCLDGWTGNKCEQGQCFRNCSKNCISPPCHHVAGECKSGCLKGWKGSNCIEECTSGYFGVDCAGFCKGCFNLSCDILEGNCEFGCNEGFHGENCEIQEKGNSVDKDSPDQQYDELGMENVSAYQDLSGPSTQNTYDQINTAYINTTLR
ncbi:unnamed protein product [Mytilus coruscus]|uniref:MEGF10_11 n=1 Tax=Mytilus coruscus TaxID=42192 RepID=A0A6J8CLM8_MYTCO|nr:unnamed protein product [Mytilus coruscus]